MIKLGLIENGIIPPKSNALTVIQNTIEYVQVAEEAGYSRFWITEHHEAAYAWKNPEIVLTLIGASTNTIRIGVAGVLMPLNPALSVAQRYFLLNNLFNNRVDLGMARGNVIPEIVEMFSGNKYTQPEAYEERCKELIHFFTSSNEYFLQTRNLLMSPNGGSPPDLWMLGSSKRNMPLAIDYKLNFSYSIFHFGFSENYLDEILKFISDFLLKNEYLPEISIALSFIGAENEYAAEQKANSYKKLTGLSNLNLVGSYQYIGDKLNEISQKSKVNEIILLNCDLENNERIHSIQKLIKAIQ